MFQGSEIFVILLVALVVLGPERLPVVARKLGKYTAELRQAARELRAGLESELGDVSGIANDLRSPINEVKQVARETTSEMRKIGTEAKKDLDEATGEARSPSSWVGPKPISGPTPEDAMADYEAIQQTGRPLDEAVSSSRVGPKPISGPTPEDAMADHEAIQQTGKPLDEAVDDDGGDVSSSWVGPKPISRLTREDAMADHEAIQQVGKRLDERVVGDDVHLPGEATG